MKLRFLGAVFAALFALQTGVVGAASTSASSAPASKHAAAKSSAKPKVAAKPSAKRAVTKKKAGAKAKKPAAVRAAAKKTITAPAAAALDHGKEGADSAGALPELGSSAFYVVNQNTGEVLLERNGGAVLPIASITKLMTAMVVLDAGQSLSERLSITGDDIDHLKGTGSRLSLGTALTREEMLNLALMSSENRAASALARNYPGGEHAFIEAMNVKARLLGLWSTRFHDSTGLNPANVSSPRDLARLVSAASSYALIREFSTAPERYVAVRGHSMRFGNTNALVKSPEWAISVSKTGYISEAGRCLVMQTWLNQQPVVMVLMDSAGRYTRTADAKRVRKWLEQMLPQRLASARHLSGG
ncbi:D-alanyl-D-alanine endopeptidase [Thauera chlorobenzoica]|uniref:Murein-DD-endopeptidase n=1 Tax=Thauera chlorobenzoica TaxID=96773 RepID=A0A1H5Y3U2_9RHOO|nr:D-alanyl-D-alanine endopeptidase [Thauera chlorobenzoica]APR03658.1 Murein-DD-endopeptidase [Thauera chlorobenzoica]SEG18270.1 murein-DD-endopeptidase. Serine peptidase. MEROPS family S11 [Thauera chlorobenzoica]